MTLYVLIALALGAISAVTDAPVAPAAVANVVRATADRRQVRPRSAAVRIAGRCEKRTLPAFRISPVPPVAVPLSGAATPRAPGRNC